MQTVTSKKTQYLSEAEFFKGLLAALRLRGVRVIDMREARHQEHFKKVAEKIAELMPAFPKIKLPLLMPEPFTGTYREFDSSLYYLQHTGLVSVQSAGPIPICAKLAVTEDLAKKQFGQFPPQCQEFFNRLAADFPNG